MLTRRKMIVTASGALAAATLPAQANLYTRSKGRIIRDLVHEAPWSRELCWIPGNSGDIGHTWTSHVSGRTTYAFCSMYRTVEPDELDIALFNGLPEYAQNLRFHGLRDHYNTRGRTQAQSAANVIDGGDRSDLLGSIYLVSWHPNAIALATPSVAPDGQPANPWRPYKAALCIRDWRYGVRIANLDMARIAQDPDNIVALARTAVDRIPWLPKDHKAAFYLPSAVKAAWDQHYGRDDVTLCNLPIRGVNALNFTEEVV